MKSALPLVAVVLIVSSATGCKKERCVPVTDDDWLAMDNRGCLDTELVCRQLDPATVSLRLLGAGDAGLENGERRAIDDLSVSLSDLRERRGCAEFSSWDVALADAYSPRPKIVPPHDSVKGIDSEAQLALMVARIEGSAFSSWDMVDGACPEAAKLKDVALGSRDEFDRHANQADLDRARRRCVDRAVLPPVVPHELLIFDFVVADTKEYDFEREVFPVELRNARTPWWDFGGKGIPTLAVGDDRLTAVIVGFPPFGPGVSQKGDCGTDGCLGISVSESEAKVVRPHLRGATVQIAASFVGFGKVPSLMNRMRGAPNAFIARAEALRVVANGSVIVPWVFIARHANGQGWPPVQWVTASDLAKAP